VVTSLEVEKPSLPRPEALHLREVTWSSCAHGYMCLDGTEYENLAYNINQMKKFMIQAQAVLTVCE